MLKTIKNLGNNLSDKEQKQIIGGKKECSLNEECGINQCCSPMLGVCVPILSVGFLYC